MTSWTIAHQAPLSMAILQARILEWIAVPTSRGSSQPRDQIQSPTFQMDSLPSESPRKPKNTGVGSLSLLQGNFLTQELNWALLHFHPTPVLLPGESHGRRSLVGCSPWDCEESDMTECPHFHFSLFMHWRRKWQPNPVFLPGESHGRDSLVGCHLWSCTESDMTEAT